MVSTRQGLIDYCLRELGAPVSEINVDDTQIEDRVDEALEYYNQYHYDGIEKVYLKQVIDASVLILTSSVAETFEVGEVITASSGASAKVAKETSRVSAGTTLLIRNIQGAFSEGETVTGTTSGATAVISTVTIGAYDRKYLNIPDAVYGITRVIPFSNSSSSKSLFDLQYQLRLNDLYDLTSTSLIYYKTVMSHLALLDLELNGYPLYRFNRVQGRLYLDVNWDSDISLGDFIVVECYRVLDPAEFTKVWNERWLKQYTAALIKRQWGANGKKFSGMQLPGGVSIDFDGIYKEAVLEIKELEDELLNKAAPLDFFVG